MYLFFMIFSSFCKRHCISLRPTTMAHGCNCWFNVCSYVYLKCFNHLLVLMRKYNRNNKNNTFQPIISREISFKTICPAFDRKRIVKVIWTKIILLLSFNFMLKTAIFVYDSLFLINFKKIVRIYNNYYNWYVFFSNTKKLSTHLTEFKYVKTIFVLFDFIFMNYWYKNNWVIILCS